MTEQQSLAQWLPVPARIWEQLSVSPVARFCELWASWPCEIRAEWMRLAKCAHYDTPGTPTWMGLSEQDRIAILKVMGKIRSIYVGSDMTSNWATIARML